MLRHKQSGFIKKRFEEKEWHIRPHKWSLIAIWCDTIGRNKIIIKQSETDFIYNRKHNRINILDSVAILLCAFVFHDADLIRKDERIVV